MSLRNYRNFENLSTEFSKNVNIFVGNNGQGKSNLIEALYVATQGYSFRLASNEQLISWDKNQAIIKTETQHSDLLNNLIVQINKSARKVTINGKTTTAQKLRQKFPLVLFSPESLSAIKEGPDSRRQLVDELLVFIQWSNVTLLADFRHCLRTRNRVLKDHRDGKTNFKQSIALLEAIDSNYLNLAGKLSAQRIVALKSILKTFNSSMNKITRTENDPDVDISVEYVISDHNAMSYSSSEVHEKLTKRLKELASVELSVGQSLVGPHKHDVRFLYNGNDSRFFCSQGQQRALILAFKIAQIVYHRSLYGSYPVLMLDDVFSELDEKRRNALVSFLHETEAQVFITSTEFNVPQALLGNQSQVFAIEKGSLRIPQELNFERGP